MKQQNIQKGNTDTLQNSDCPICHGIHFVHPVVDDKVDYFNIVPCSCRLKEIETLKKESLIRYCELPPMVETMNFDNFKVYKEVQEAFKIAKSVAQSPDKIHWLTFMGVNDTGKTHLAISICKEWISKGIAAKYAFVPLLLDELKEGFKHEGNDSYNSRFQRFLNAPLLVLDDLFTEVSTPWVREKLETIVDYRYMNKKSLIITTNKSLEEMDYISPRLRSRLMRHPNAQIIVFQTKEYTLRRFNEKGKNS